MINFNFDFPDFPFHQPVIPEVEVVVDRTRWRPGGTRAMGPLNRLLWDFKTLKKATVAEFVKKYGPLYLCSKHGWPPGHLRDQVCCPPHVWKEGGDLFLGEEVARYLELSQWLGAIVEIAKKARSGTPLTDAELRATALVDDPADPLYASSPHFADMSEEPDARVWILVNLWLRIGDPRPWLGHRANGTFGFEFRAPRVKPPPAKQLLPGFQQLSYGGQLFAALAMQLATHVSGGMGLTTCDGCGVLYVPKRTPIQGKKHFCSRCGKTAANRLWKRRQQGGRP